MKHFILAFFIPIITFTLGVGVFRVSIPTVSIETISENTSFYDGMNVEIESYVQLVDFGDNDWYLGEPFEKKEVFTLLKTEDLGQEIEILQKELKVNLSKSGNMRAKVRVTGRITDNCKFESGISRCCFGQSITVKAIKMIQISPVEFYIRPDNH